MKKGKRFFFWAFLLFILWIFLPKSDSKAEEASPSPKKSKLKERGILLGYGKASLKGEDYEFITLLPRFGWDIKPKEEKNASSHSGIYELLLEPVFSAVFQPESNEEIGLNLLLKLGQPLSSKLIAFIEGGAGIIYISQHTEEQSTQYNFTPQAGAGLQYFLSKNWTITAAYRFRHLSNAGIKQPNGGFNANLFLLGFSFFP